MDRTETLKILSLVKVAYPNSYNKMSDDELKSLTLLWENQFKEYEFEMVAIAVNSFISEDLSGYAPTIAQIKNLVRKLTSPASKTDNEIWEPVYFAICNGYYNANEEYAKLPSDIQECVSPSQIHSWSMFGAEEMQFVKKEVVNEYRQRETRRTEYEMLPQRAREMIDGISIKLIGEKDE